jgi:hypothetical protein
MAKNENDSPYIQDGSVSENKASWLNSRAAKITAIAVGSSLALGAAFAGGAVAGQLTGGARGGDFGIGQSGPNFDGDRHADESRPGGPDGQRPPHAEKGERGAGEDHDGPKSFGPPVGAPAPNGTTTTAP